MYANGLTVQYLKDNQPVESKITGWSNHDKFDLIYLENGDEICDTEIIAIKEDYEATDFINFRKVSLFLAGGTENIRSNKIPAKYFEAVKELTDFMKTWIVKHK